MGTLSLVCLGVVTVVHLAFGISAYFQVTVIDITIHQFNRVIQVELHCYGNDKHFFDFRQEYIMSTPGW